MFLYTLLPYHYSFMNNNFTFLCGLSTLLYRLTVVLDSFPQHKYKRPELSYLQAIVFYPQSELKQPKACVKEKRPVVGIWSAVENICLATFRNQSA